MGPNLIISDNGAIYTREHCQKQEQLVESNSWASSGRDQQSSAKTPPSPQSEYAHTSATPLSNKLRDFTLQGNRLPLRV